MIREDLGCDFGMPTLIETKTLGECISLCRELNLQFIELNMNLPQYQRNQMDAAALKKAADLAGIYYTIHLDENLNVSDFNPYVAEAYRKTVGETIEMAKVLNCPVLNMHLSAGVVLDRGERLHHMHLHDAAGAKNHLPLGVGELDLKGYLGLAKSHKCRVVLETKNIGGLRQSVNWLKL